MKLRPSLVCDLIVGALSPLVILALCGCVYMAGLGRVW